MIYCNLCSKTVEKFHPITTKCFICSANNKERLSFIFLKKNKLVKNKNFLDLSKNETINKYCKKQTTMKTYFDQDTLDVSDHKNNFFDFINDINIIQKIGKNNDLLDELKRVMIKSASLIGIIDLDNVTEEINTLELLKKEGFFIRLHITDNQFNNITQFKYDNIKIICSEDKNQIHGIGNIILCEAVKKIEYMKGVTKW
ncbi:hypothetical protein CPAV1605_1257 [seawater metagenome]|uniref:Uncharacterized protein n=1 Tax=seawater metagenome TaxID=1561972 RepID=A0A5E8CJZ9_9ZZZZ